MEFLFSNFPPLKTKNKSFSNKFDELLIKSEELKIASGFISADSITELQKLIEFNNKPKLELLIGMHYFNGFTQKEYFASNLLNSYLTDNYLGKRVKGGLFQSSTNKLINADVNGAINILRKVIGDDFVKNLINTGNGYLPIRIKPNEYRNFVLLQKSI